MPRAYDAGRRTRADLDFMPRPFGPNALADQTLDLARRRVRHLVDNNPLLSGARNTLRNNVVGTGIKVQPDTGDTELDRALEDGWRNFCEGVDPDRTMSLAASQGQFFDEVWSSGEVLRFDSIAPEHNGHPEGPAVELIDAERIELSHTAEAMTGMRIRQGVEFNAAGQRVAYHVLTAHPNDLGVSMAAARDRRRILAADAELCFIPRRIGQVRGVPWAVSVVGTTRMEEAFHEAYLMLARIAACLGAFIEGTSGPALASSTKLTDSDGQPIDKLEPGLIGYLPAGAKVNIGSASVPPPTWGMTEEILHRRMAAGLNVSYAAISRDYSKATFSATRAEQLEDRKHYRPLQEFVYQHHTRPLYRRWVDWAVLTGALKLTPAQQKLLRDNREALYACTVIMPGWEWINPKDEASAAETELRIGSATLQQLAAARGTYWRDLVDQALQVEKYETDRRKELGLGPKVVVGTPTPAAPARNPSSPAPGSPSPNDSTDDSTDDGQDDGQDNGDNQDTQPANDGPLVPGGGRNLEVAA
jgi:lambda family phage portal protein